jgi:hypothetical protein
LKRRASRASEKEGRRTTLREGCWEEEEGGGGGDGGVELAGREEDRREEFEFSMKRK